MFSGSQTFCDIPIPDGLVELLELPYTHDLVLVFIKCVEHTRRLGIVQIELVFQEVDGIGFLQTSHVLVGVFVKDELDFFSEKTKLSLLQIKLEKNLIVRTQTGLFSLDLYNVYVDDRHHNLSVIQYLMCIQRVYNRSLFFGEQYALAKISEQYFLN